MAALLQKRNAIDAKIAEIIHRPMTAGHLGEWLAAGIFDIQLMESATTAGLDGYFRSGPLRGRSVDIKWYLKQEGLLDVTESPDLDYYLVMTGPIAPAASSRNTVRPWCVDFVYLFDARALRQELIERGVKRGTATSVRKHQWLASEIYPSATNPSLPLTPDQRGLLQRFHSV